MNKLMLGFVFAILLVSFASAQAAETVEASESKIAIQLIFPTNGQILETADGAMDVTVRFSAVSDAAASSEASATDPGNAPFQCIVEISNTDGEFVSFEPFFDTSNNEGSVTSKFTFGTYVWNVICSNKDGSPWTSSDSTFTIQEIVPVAPAPTPTPTNNGGNGGGSNNDDDGNGGSVASALVPLSTTPQTNSESTNEESSSEPAGITGAVIGFFGKKSVLGVLVFIAIVGVATLAVYNRRKSSAVKSQ